METSASARRRQSSNLSPLQHLSSAPAPVNQGLTEEEARMDLPDLVNSKVCSVGFGFPGIIANFMGFR